MTQRQLMEPTNSPRWRESLSDLVSRFVQNRVTATSPGTAVSLTGAVQSAGIGTSGITARRYAEVQVNARATFSINGSGSLYAYVVRTTGSIPVNGAGMNAGDVIVGGGAFAGPATVAALQVHGSLSFIDEPLSVNQAYKYYFALSGTDSLIGTLVSGSQLMVSEF